MSDNRPPIYWEDGAAGEQLIIRGSSLGSCPLRLATSAHRSAPIPDHVQAAFDIGHEHEEIVVDRLTRKGLTVLARQKELELELAGATVRGHIDGLVFCSDPAQIPEALRLAGWDGRLAVLEIKSGDESSYTEFVLNGLTKKRTYRYQVAAYSIAAGRKSNWNALWDHDGPLPVVYVWQCKSDLNLAFRYFETPPVDPLELTVYVAEVKERVRQLAAGESLTCKLHHEEQFPCGFPDLHEETALPEGGQVLEFPSAYPPADGEPPTAEVHLLNLFTEFQRTQLLGKHAEAEQEAAKAALQAHLEFLAQQAGANPLTSVFKIGDFHKFKLQTRTSTSYAEVFRRHPELAGEIKLATKTSAPFLSYTGPKKGSR